MMEKEPTISEGVPHKKSSRPPGFQIPLHETGNKLEILVKSDSMGTREAVMAAVESLVFPEVDIEIIQSGVGHISKSDLLMAEAGSRLILGFNVDILPRVKELAKEHRVEVRLYRVIYNLTDDLKKIAATLARIEDSEKITGKAKVIAVFPGGRKSVILGCRVEEGVLAVGNKFRVISAPGPVYVGTIDSLHIEKDAVRQAKPGQQVGLRISGFKRARIGDFVECFETVRSNEQSRWRPRGGVFRF
jgi:translation initiation factor IF-2